MPAPTKVDLTNKGVIRRFTASDRLEIDNIDRRAVSGNMTMGSNLGAAEELVLGSVTSDVRILGDMIIDGSETVSTDETITGTFNANGDVNLGTGNDTINLGGGSGDVINLNADLVVGAGTITIGSSVTDFVDAIFLDAVNANGPALAAYDLNASGTNAGAYAIGVDPSLLVSSVSTDLMTMLDDMDAAISAASSTLQQAYEAGNTINVTAANGAPTFTNSTDSDGATVLSVTKGASVSTGGNLAVFQMGTNTTGIALFVDNQGTGNTLQVQDAGSDVLIVSGAGAVTVTPTSGQNYSLTTAGVGTIALTSATGDITLDATAAELVLDDVGNSTTTLSQVSDRTFDLTGTNEPLNGATSLLGAINRIARRIATEGIFQAEKPIENGVVIAAGDIIAASTTAGRVTQNNDNQSTRSAVIGVALTGGTGDAGGTVFTRFFLPGAVVTDAGASFTAGAELFAPDGTGRATGTAPTANGDRVTRIGYAFSATEYVFNPVEGFVL